MNTIERTTGKAYTKDAEYAAFSGRVVQTFHTTYYDPKEKVWIKRTVEYIDVGRADAVKPIDPDAEMEPEEMEHYYSAAESLIARKRQAEAKHRAVKTIVSTHIRDRGPISVGELARRINMPKEWTRLHLLMFENQHYVRLPVNKQSDLWGLVGVHDKAAA